MYVARLNFIAGPRGVHEGFDYMAEIFRAMHARFEAFNMLLLFAFRFLYARVRARANCIPHLTNIDV